MSSPLSRVNGSAKSETNAGAPVDKAEWDAFVDSSPQGSIYCKTWWLDAVCPGGYELLTVREGGHIRAGMVLPLSRVGGRSIVRMPPLTQTLGPLLSFPVGQKYESRLTHEMKLVRQLIGTIPPVDDFFMNCSQHYTNWLPFHWAGYSQSTRYSYEIEDLADIDAIYHGMSDKTRNIIRKAERAGIGVEECDDLKSIFPLFEMTYRRQGMDMPHEFAMLDRLDRGAVANAGRRIFVARDAQGRVHASTYVVHTPQSTYYVMQGTDPELRGSGAPLLAHWHAIRFAATVSRRYDFVGSMMENVERVFRSFGAVQKHYFSIYRHKRRATWRDLASVGKKLLTQTFMSRD